MKSTANFYGLSQETFWIYYFFHLTFISPGGSIENTFSFKMKTWQFKMIFEQRNKKVVDAGVKLNEQKFFTVSMTKCGDTRLFKVQHRLQNKPGRAEPVSDQFLGCWFEKKSLSYFAHYFLKKQCRFMMQFINSSTAKSTCAQSWKTSCCYLTWEKESKLSTRKSW